MTGQSLFGFTLIGSTALFLAAGCAAQAAEVPSDFRLEYSRGPCEGFCPEYSVTVDAAGRVKWLGKSSVKHKGPATKTLSTTAVHDIAAALRSLHLEGARTEIRCLDSPILFISVTMNQTTASVRATRDCGESRTPVVEQAFDVGKLLDQIVGVESWVGAPKKKSQ